MRNVLLEHRREPWAVEERCTMCGAEAWHKVAEDITGARRQRHPFTAYVCCGCFGAIMGPVAVEWCSGGVIPLRGGAFPG